MKDPFDNLPKDIQDAIYALEVEVGKYEFRRIKGRDIKEFLDNVVQAREDLATLIQTQP